MLLFLQFLALTGVILYAGSNLSKYGDVIAEKTGMGRAWIGVILLASATSLPELITGFSSVVIFDVPEIAAGNVLGACMLNLLSLALLDSLSRSQPLTVRAQQGHVLTAGFGILLLGVVAMSIVIGPRLPALGWVGVNSLLLLLLYLLAVRLLFLYERRRMAERVSDDPEESLYPAITMTRAYSMYAINALLIIGAAVFLPSIGERIAEATGLGETFVGNIFIAFATTLPELVVSVAALRMGAVDMAFGNILGSNLFNLAILAVDDLLYTQGPLLAAVSANHVVTANAAMVMTAMLVIALVYRATRKRFFLAGESVGMAGVFLAATLLLYTLR